MKVIFEPAECDPNCDAPGCHYMHSPGWYVGDVSFQTEREAQEHLSELEAAERQLMDGISALTGKTHAEEHNEWDALRTAAQKPK